MFLFAIFAQIVALILLLSLVALGYWFLARPYASRVGIQGKGLLLLIVIIFAGGFLGSFFWWFDLLQSFSWDLPPLASRMLASAGWSFAVVCFLCLRRPTPRRVRLVLLLTAIYLLPLVAAALIFHLDRFDFTVPLTYGFFVIAGSITVAVLWYLLRQPTIIKDDALDSAPSNWLTRFWIAGLTVVLAIWGLALFITDAGPSNLIWVWPGDLLTSRLIGVMLLALAVGLIYSLLRADTARLMLWTTGNYGAGLALGSAWNILLGVPIKPSYFFFFGFIFCVSAGLLLIEWWLSRKPALA